MKKPFADKRIIRLIDANRNRLTEGLRVCEDIARFILDDKSATRRLKSIRHRALSAVKRLGADKRLLAKFRDSEADVGKTSIKSERRRNTLADLFRANAKRSEESMRVLEEFAKLSSAASADAFKQMRFELYSLEKSIVEKL